MIEHLRGRDRKLEPLGWTGREAEWIALVCLHSGVFTRAQFCHYFDTDRKRALRFVKALVGAASGGGERNPCVLRGSQAVLDIQQADLPGAETLKPSPSSTSIRGAKRIASFAPGGSLTARFGMRYARTAVRSG